MEQRASFLERQIDFTVRASSRERSWTGFSATVYDATDGVDETRFANHCVSMHVGSPVSITTRCDGKTVRRLQVVGDLKLVPCGFSRVWEVEAPTTKLTMHVSPSLLRTAAAEMGVSPDHEAVAPQLHVRDPQIEHIGWALKAELETNAPNGRLYADSLGLALAAQLLRRYSCAPPPSIAGALPRRRLREVLDYIHAHVGDDLSLAELARVASVSQSHFKVQFKRSVGVPVHEFVIRTRVDYAAGLIVADEASLCEIALRAGFANQSHMAHCMRRVNGKTPGALRRDG